MIIPKTSSHLTLHQAFFGDNNGSHNLLAASIDDRKLIGWLKLNTDAPASVPITFPYISGGPVECYYVFTRTMKDESAKRPGMVFSHCLVLPLDELSEIVNLKDVFSSFVQAPVHGATELRPITIEKSVAPAQKLAVFDSCLNSLLKHKLTSVFIGYEGFEEVIAALWQRFPTGIKESFSFSLAGSPNEIIIHSFSLVNTPAGYESRWTKYPVIHPLVIKDKSLAFVFLDNPEAEESKELQEFIQEHHIAIRHVYEITDIARLYRLIREAGERKDLVHLKKVINGINTWMPDPSIGIKTKEMILQSFMDGLRVADADGFKLLRNMSFSCFPNGQTQVEGVAEIWSRNFLNPGTENEIYPVVDLLNETFFGAAPSWWKEIIEVRLQDICGRFNMAAAKWFWAIWLRDVRLITETKEYLPVQAEEALLQVMPEKVEKQILEDLIGCALSKQWFALHAVLVARSLDPSTAIITQLAIDHTKDLEQHLLLMTRSVDEEDFVEAAVDINNDTVYKVAGQLCAKSPQILSKLDVSHCGWQSIWYQSFLLSNDITKGVHDLNSVLCQLLDLLIQNESVNQGILDQVVIHAGHIYFYGSRRNIWSELDEKNKSALLNKTGEYLIENFESIEFANLDPELINHVRGDNYIQQHLIGNKKMGVSNQIKFLETISNLNEDYLIAIFQKGIIRLQYSDIDLISGILKARRWRRALSFLFDNRKSSQVCNQIVENCKDLFSLWQQLFIKKNMTALNQSQLLRAIDHQDLPYVFDILDSLEINDMQYNRLKKEFIAGAKNVDLWDLSERLKTYIRSLS